MLQFNELPTGEYIRIVRVLVKHLHAFSASARADDTHMLQLRKVATPMMQGKVYIFLRNLVNRWPLDGSFRLVLELWLSFIQPWRYQGPTFLKTVYVTTAKYLSITQIKTFLLFVELIQIQILKIQVQHQ